MSNVKIEELRIGNLVEQGIIRTIGYSNGVSGCHIVKSEYDSSGGDWHNAELIKPIPLTEEWLVKFGANKVNHIDGYIFWTFKGSKLNPCHISIYENRIEHYGYPVSKNMTVHYLQNLYFALTGEELAINKKDVTNP